MFRIGIYLTDGSLQVCKAFEGIKAVELTVLPDIGSVENAVANLDAVVLQNASYTPAVAAAISHSNRLSWLQAAAAGIDAFQRIGVPSGVRFTNAGDVWSACVADHAIALLLGLWRGLPVLERLRQERRWDRSAITPSLRGVSFRRAAVIGFGNIGRAVANRARGFEMDVVGVVRRVPDDGSTSGIQLAPIAKLCNVLADADVVFVCLPLSEETRGLIGATAFQSMKREAVFVNVSRGDIVDQEALIKALALGQIAGAGLDVAEQEPLPPDSPLWAFDNVVISPHIGGFDNGPSFERLGELCRENALRIIAGIEPRNRIFLT